MRRGQTDLLNGKLLIKEQRLRCQEGKLFKLATLGSRLLCVHKHTDNSLTSCLLADFCTAFMPDSDKIEPAERSSKGETFGAWKKSKTALRSSKKAAFTLAEILITLAVIGVVAAMTIPTLIQNYKKTVLINSFKKTYSLLQQAVALSQVENGPLDTWDYSQDGLSPENQAKFAETYIVPYLKIVKNCGTDINKGCAPQKVVVLNGGNWPYGGTDDSQNYKAVLADGVPITIGYVQNCIENKTYCFSISSHIQGLKKVGIMGRDYFTFDAYPGLNSIYPRGVYNNATDEFAYLANVNCAWVKRTKSELETGCCTESGCNHADWCGGRILIDGYKMNY